MGLPFNGTIPAPFSERRGLAREAGLAVMGLIEHDIRPSAIMTRPAFLNAIAVDMAIGGSTNTVLHLPAIAREYGINLELDTFQEIAEKTPNLTHIRPSGDHTMEDLDRDGGIPAVIKRLSPLLDLNGFNG